MDTQTGALTMAHASVFRFAQQYTQHPGGRYPDEGEFSGIDFCDKVLEPLFRGGTPTTIDVDGVYGFCTGFLDGAFGEFAFRHGAESFRSFFTIKSDDDPSLLVEVEDCLKRAEEERLAKKRR